MVSALTSLKTDHLTIGYKEGKKEKVILEDIDLELKSGELVCLMGPNGIGKSTLIRTLSGLQNPLSGSVYINNSPLNTISESERSKLVSVVLTDRLQGGNLRVRELIAMGRYPYLSWLTRFSEEDNEAVAKAIEAIDLSDILDSKLHQLSDGQFQRAMIARALVQDGEVMILDEPTAHLDLNNRVETMRLLRKLAHDYQKSILMATHELDLALQLSDRLILVQPGGNLLDGIPEDLILKGNLDDTFLLKGYNLKTGKAEFVPFKQKQVSLFAEDYYYLWSKNVLERNGFEVVSEDRKVDIRLSVTGSNDEFECKVEILDQTETFSSFEGLLNRLNTI
jgi:iron complex transport system ATP-binding protein